MAKTLLVLLFIFILYLFFKVSQEQKQKKWLLSTILDPLPEKASLVNLLIKGKHQSLAEDLTSLLSELIDNGYWLSFRIDWSDPAEVESQGNALAQAYGITELFEASSVEKETSVWSQLVQYDIWLQQQGYEVVLWDQGSDEYCGFICQTVLLEQFINAGKSSGLELIKLNHLTEQ